MGKLQVAIALLPDAELNNRLAATALAAHTASHGRLRWPRLQAHLSLKQPFVIESLAAVERILEQLAGELAPLRVMLGATEVQPPSPGSPEAVVWVGVDSHPSLVELERRLESAFSTAALSPAASSPTAGSSPAADAASPFVSDAYRFHVTLGFLPTTGVGAEASLPSLAGVTAAFPELGVFVYDGLPRAGWQCMLYARRSLSGGPSGPMLASSR